MTKKDYIRIGNALRWHWRSVKMTAAEAGHFVALIRGLGDALRSDNSRFSKDRFDALIFEEMVDADKLCGKDRPF